MSHAQPMRQETIIRIYRKPDEYQRDAQRLSRDGWSVSNVTERRPRSGCLRVFLLLGFLALVFPPKPELVVTYTRMVPA